jgi:hypothetical protein
MIRLALILSLLTAPAFGGTFYPLDARYVDGISADGSVAVAYRTAESSGEAGTLLWTRQRTTQIASFQASDISADGSTVVGGDTAWTVDGVRSYSSPLVGVSGDGSKVVSRDGTLFTATGQTELGFTATDISADGNWVVGEKDGLPYLWNGAGKFLGDQPVTEGLTFDAYVSADGSIVHITDYRHDNAVRWQEETGVVAAPYFGRFRGVSSNGLFAVGEGRVIDDQGET